MNLNSSSLQKIITYAVQKKFTGKISLVAPQNSAWEFYFFEGMLAWIESGIHPNRIWLRYIKQYFPNVNLDKLKINLEEKTQNARYQALKTLQQQNSINLEQTNQMIFDRAKEIFFDIFFEETQNKLEIKIAPLNSQQLSNLGFDSTIRIANLKELFQKSYLEYANFLKQGKVGFSFNAAPLIVNSEALRSEVAPHIYSVLLQYLDGKRTLKAIAAKINQKVTSLALLIIPYLKKKFIKLAQLEDIALPFTTEVASTNSQPNNYQAQAAATKTATVVCVDDSPLICNMMNQIVEKLGYKFVGINDPLKAIPVLIQAKPSLIFVDLAMPVINGYELCSQIQKISQLKETPLVMLTGRDFIAERVKTKVIGISDFIGKPIVEEKITLAIEKYVK